jgi:hypothetical protein
LGKFSPVTPVKGEEKIELTLSQKLQNSTSQDPTSGRCENPVTYREALSKLFGFKLYKMAVVVRSNSLGKI